MRIFPNGWCDEAAIRPSEHFNERPEGEEISLLVIHNISLPAGQFGTGDVDALFCGTLDCCKHPSYQDLEGLRVSSHFFIDRSGRLFQYVSCLDRAWHAGVSSYEGRENCNDFSIGVELEGTDSAPYEQAQYETLGRLTDALAEAYPIKYVTGHSMIAPLRKNESDTLPTITYQDLDISKMELPPGWRGYGAKNYIDNPETPVRQKQVDEIRAKLESEGADRFAVQNALMPYLQLLPEDLRGKNERIDEPLS